MCGFVGFIDKNEKERKQKIIKQMADRIIHRGPDSDGYYVDDNIALGFRRLSIIDLEGGTQPMFNEDNTLVVAFNGEIYNYQEIKKDLEEKGHNFKTNADTEVLVHGYEEYKIDLFNKLRGMFAFVIYDINNQELIGVRDFYGIKPFYYYNDNQHFMFGSEIKSFLAHPEFKKELNINQLESYLTFQYSVGTNSFFKNVYKLEPGHYVTCKNNKLEVNKYYDFNFEATNLDLDYYVNGIENVMESSIKAHKVSDVEVGSFLSSGVDSSYIAKASEVDKTFTVGFDDKRYSEIDYAKGFAEAVNLNNEYKYISKEEFFEVFPKVQYHMDEPIADPSAVALYFVANIASKKVKVALSGEGADEVFGGYNIYQEPYTPNWYMKIPFFIRRIPAVLFSFMPNIPGINFLIRKGTKLEDRYVGNAFIFNNKEVKKLLLKQQLENDYKNITKPYYNKLQELDDCSKMQYIDFKTWLVGDILLKADKMSMANSLEVRVPFLDKEVIDFARKIPTKYKITKTETKYAFRMVANKKLKHDVSKKKKLGFPVPTREWLKEENIYNLIKEKFLNSHGFFNQKYLLELLDEHYHNKKDNSRKIWTIYTFLVWYEQYFDDSNNTNVRFVENINESDYSYFVENHQKSHFLQSYEWGQFSKGNKGMIPHYVGLVNDKNNLVGAALLLQKKLLFGYSYFYAPRGYVIDYSNQKLLEDFTREIKKYLKKNKGVFLTIDPDIKYQDIDKDANPIANGFNNYKLFNTLLKLNYKHKGFNKLYESNQPRYTFRINLTNQENKKNHQFDNSFMKSVKRSYNYQMEVIVNDDVKRFHELISEVAKRDSFSEYSYNYYQNFYNIFKENNHLKMYSACINPKELIKDRQAEKEKLEQILSKDNIREGQKKETTFVLDRVKKEIEIFKPYEDEEKIIVASLIMVYYGNKAWTLYLGSDNLAKETFAVNRIYYEVITDIKNSEDNYIVDLFGTVGDPNTDHKNLKGLHEYKQKFGGEYIEFIGDFDLINNKFLYSLLPIMLKIYRNLKK